MKIIDNLQLFFENINKEKKSIDNINVEVEFYYDEENDIKVDSKKRRIVIDIDFNRKFEVNEIDKMINKIFNNINKEWIMRNKSRQVIYEKNKFKKKLKRQRKVNHLKRIEEARRKKIFKDNVVEIKEKTWI